MKDITEFINSITESDIDSLQASIDDARNQYLTANDSLALYCLRLLHKRDIEALRCLCVKIDITAGEVSRYLQLITNAYNNSEFIQIDTVNTAKFSEDSRGYYLYFRKHHDLKLYLKVDTYKIEGLIDTYRTTAKFFFTG